MYRVTEKLWSHLLSGDETLDTHTHTLVVVTSDPSSLPNTTQRLRGGLLLLVYELYNHN